MKIAHILGGWGQNIGNAFFQLGGLYALQKAAPSAEVAIISEKPGYPSYWNPKGGNPTSYFDATKYLDIDYLVLMGPIFRPETEQIWGDSLRRAQEKGVKLILLGIGAMQYSAADIEKYRTFLSKYRPFILTSRDSSTYQNLGDLATHAFDGIDLGFFIPDVYSPLTKLAGASEIAVLNFDMLPEPRIRISDQSFDKKCDYDRTFEFDSKTWQVNFPPFRTKLANRSRVTMLLEGMVFRGNSVDYIENYQILRTDHRLHPAIAKKTYRYPNVLVNDTPYPYLDCYRSARITLSNRVHACVAALSYGNHAMLFSRTPRSMLLERIGVESIGQCPQQADMKVLEKEKKDLLQFLGKTIK
jgi:hypothetical protein